MSDEKDGLFLCPGGTGAALGNRGAPIERGREDGKKAFGEGDGCAAGPAGKKRGPVILRERSGEKGDLRDEK